MGPTDILRCKSQVLVGKRRQVEATGGRRSREESDFAGFSVIGGREKEREIEEAKRLKKSERKRDQHAWLGGQS